MEELRFKTVYFSKPGKEHTDATLELAKQRAIASGIRSVLVATTTGYTGAKAVEIFSDQKVIAVTHSAGFKEPNDQELTEENRALIESKGGKVLTCQHAMGGINRAIRKKLNTYQPDEIIAFALRTFGEGMKVVFEISLMAADAGLVRTGEPAIAIAGTGRGADTAALLLPANAQSFFDLRILEIICMPSPKHPDFMNK